jgi:hypothetical protein
MSCLDVVVVLRLRIKHNCAPACANVNKILSFLALLLDATGFSISFGIFFPFVVVVYV